jgi:hypothetical protein
LDFSKCNVLLCFPLPKAGASIASRYPPKEESKEERVGRGKTARREGRREDKGVKNQFKILK